MIETSKLLNNEDKVAIVVVGYNRYKSLKRLLDSLQFANYESNDIPLIISIDCSGDERVYNLAKDFEWTHGSKYVNIETERLGLVKHIFQCAGLTEYFKAVILLEDDLFVSPYFYHYVLKVLENYRNPEFAQISLYKPEVNGYVGMPFSEYKDGSDVFLMQAVSTWGQCWTKGMWCDFLSWYNTRCTENLIDSLDMPKRIKGWKRAWSRYYNAYLVDQNKFVLFPCVSLTTNFSDAGEHGNTNNSIVQVNLLQNKFEYRFPEYDRLTKYDIYNNNLLTFRWLSEYGNNVSLDLYGYHLCTRTRYILSTRILPFQVIKKYALNLRPIELNIKYQLQGEGIYLYDTFTPKAILFKTSTSLMTYYLGALDRKSILRYVIFTYPKFIMNYIHLRFKQLLK